MTTVKGIILTLALGAGAIALAVWDPFNLNPDGINGEGWAVALYFIPVFGFIIYKVFKK